MQANGKSQRVALVTGASSGLGLAIAEKLAAEGLLVIFNARTEKTLRLAQAKLSTSAKLHSCILVADASDNKFAIKLKALLHKHKLNHLDLVIHAAAVNHMGRIDEIRLANAEATLRINSLSVVNLAQATEAFLEQSGLPRFVLVSSLMKYFNMPGRSVYAASKAAAEQFAEAWAHELEARNSRIFVQIFRPASIETNFHENTASDGKAARSTVSRMSSDAIADYLLWFISSQKREMAPGFMNKVAAFMARYFPLLTNRYIQRRFRKKS